MCRRIETDADDLLPAYIRVREDTANVSARSNIPVARVLLSYTAFAVCRRILRRRRSDNFPFGGQERRFARTASKVYAQYILHIIFHSSARNSR